MGSRNRKARKRGLDEPEKADSSDANSNADSRSRGMVLQTHLPPIVCNSTTTDAVSRRDTVPDSLRREDTAPRLLSHVNRRRRMYAKAMNVVESERLANVHRRLDLAQSMMEQRLDKQSEKLRKLLEDINAHDRHKLSSTLPPDPPPWRVPPKENEFTGTTKRTTAQLASSSCPSFAFSSVTPDAPLGRWVRYPRMLPTLQDTAARTRRKHSVIREDGEESEEIREEE